MEVLIKRPLNVDLSALKLLYEAVAESPDGLIRQREEITMDYLETLRERVQSDGLILSACVGESIVGAIHAYTPEIRAFRHLLTDLSILVHPDFQGKGIGKKLFTAFLEKVMGEFNHILRVELYTRAHNTRNVKFYEDLGFINEGAQPKKIRVGKDSFHTPLHMAWFNPNYKEQ